MEFLGSMELIGLPLTLVAELLGVRGSRFSVNLSEDCRCADHRNVEIEQ